MKRRVWQILIAIFLIGTTVVILTYFFRPTITGLPADDQYFPEQLTSHEKYIINNFPDIPVKKEIPYFSSDEYFDYRVMPSFEMPDKFDVFLTPRFSDVYTIEEVFSNTQSNILQWIANRDTLVSNIKIDWYIIYNNQKVLVDQTNPDE